MLILCTEHITRLSDMFLQFTKIIIAFDLLCLFALNPAASTPWSVSLHLLLLAPSFSMEMCTSSLYSLRIIQHWIKQDHVNICQLVLNDLCTSWYFILHGHPIFGMALNFFPVGFNTVGNTTFIEAIYFRYEYRH